MTADLYQQVVSGFQLGPLVGTHTGMRTEKQAAVLIPILLRPQPSILLTVRSPHLRHHPGQVALPGGKHDRQDPTLLATALRETYEELGIAPCAFQLLGQLAAVNSSSGFSVTPFIATTTTMTVRPNPDEVADYFELPLTCLWHKNAFCTLSISRGNRSASLYLMRHSSPLIWGMTAQILAQFSQQVARFNNDLVTISD